MRSPHARLTKLETRTGCYGFEPVLLLTREECDARHAAGTIDPRTIVFVLPTPEEIARAEAEAACHAV